MGAPAFEPLGIALTGIPRFPNFVLSDLWWILYMYEKWNNEAEKITKKG